MTSLANSNTEALLQVELSRARRPLLLQLSSIWWLDSDSWSRWHCTSYTKLCMKMGQRFPQRLIGVKVSECIMIYNLTSTTAFSLFHKIKIISWISKRQWTYSTYSTSIFRCVQCILYVVLSPLFTPSHKKAFYGFQLPAKIDALLRSRV